MSTGNAFSWDECKRCLNPVWNCRDWDRNTSPGLVGQLLPLSKSSHETSYDPRDHSYGDEEVDDDYFDDDSGCPC